LILFFIVFKGYPSTYN